ncbi:hypothetical protein [Paenibacillus eucommiae]|uniref:Uncharacterized protein n=1 Tax=Paenibacillus eucommiae TaxID=1355755 RepID=A0ABS4ILM3_9BACL|nr:hypothetical protein [Paenibacillus eucommiae]MBP1988472.1 hypothetical protein [Paenibacillus eucommiae]
MLVAAWEQLNLRRNERVLHLTMIFIVKASVPGQAVTLAMIFIVKIGQMASQGG